MPYGTLSGLQMEDYLKGYSYRSDYGITTQILVTKYYHQKI